MPTRTRPVPKVAVAAIVLIMIQLGVRAVLAFGGISIGTI